jgi:hypothetical protein
MGITIKEIANGQLRKNRTTTKETIKGIENSQFVCLAELETFDSKELK